MNDKMASREHARIGGYERYSQARELFITADCGGSNGYRTRLWKLELQRLADELGSRSPYATFPRAPASGIRSSIGCSRSSPSTGGENHCARTKLW